MAAVTVDGFEVPNEVLAKNPEAIHAHVEAEKKKAGWVPKVKPKEGAAPATEAASSDVETPAAPEGASSSTRRAKSEGPSKRASTEG